MARHAEVAAGFAVLAVVWTLPLALHLSTHLPGPAVGDNAIFLWNFWWIRQALASHPNVFHTPYLFAPVGELPVRKISDDGRRALYLVVD
jgi:hypothetical protein